MIKSGPTSFLFICLAICLITSACAQAESVTIATFSDPTFQGTMPSFTVDLSQDLITGGWDDSEDNLTLNLPFSGEEYTDVYFTMTPIAYTGNLGGGQTEGGSISFFESGQDINTEAIFRIDFIQAWLNYINFGQSDGFSSDGVTFSGTALSGNILTDESFAFSFTNYQPLGGDWANGFTASASFTSSAAIPEPASMILLGAGSLVLLRRKRE
jgi:hypothetical protein